MTRLSFRPMLIAAIALGWCVACGQSGAPSWVAQTEAAHRAASQELASGDPSAARDALSRAVALPVPHSIRAEDARIVRQDLYYRLAMLELDAQRAQPAAEWASTGLELGVRDDVFTANLYIVRAKAQEELGHALAASRDYHAALQISEVLLDRALGEETP